MLWIHQLTYCSLILWSLFLYISISLTAGYHILIILPSTILFFKALKNKQLNFSKSMLAIFIFIFAAMASILINSPSIDGPIKNIFKLKYLVIGLISIFALRGLALNYLTDKRKRILIQIFLWGATIATISGLIGYFTGFNPLKFKAAHPDRAGGMYGQIMSYAYSICLFCLGVLVAIINSDRIKSYVSRTHLIIIFLINILGLTLTFTRGALLGFFIALPFVFFHTHKRLFWRLFSLISTLSGILIILLFVGIRPDQTLRQNSKMSDSIRTGIYEAALEMVQEHPLTGVGFRNVEPTCPLIQERNHSKYPIKSCGHAHNNYLEIAAGTGLLGFIPFIFFLLLWFRELIQFPSIINTLALPSLVAFIVSGMFQSTIIDGEIMFFLMGLYALTQINISEGLP